jgi:hypothetical protein
VAKESILGYMVTTEIMLEAIAVMEEIAEDLS